MQMRVAMWHRLAQSQSPMFGVPKHVMTFDSDLGDDDRILHALLEAREQASEDERRQPCRTLRILVGFKPNA